MRDGGAPWTEEGAIAFTIRVLGRGRPARHALINGSTQKQVSGYVWITPEGRERRYVWLVGGTVLLPSVPRSGLLGVVHQTLLSTAVAAAIELPDAQFVHVTYDLNRRALLFAGNLAVEVIDHDAIAALSPVAAISAGRGWRYPSPSRAYRADRQQGATGPHPRRLRAPSAHLESSRRRPSSASRGSSS